MRWSLPALVHALALGALLAVLAGCGAQPRPMMFGAERVEAERDGRRYVLFRKGDAVEVIRLGYAGWGEHAAIRATMIALMSDLTGCRLRDHTAQGDSGEMRGRLSCPRPPKPPDSS